MEQQSQSHLNEAKLKECRSCKRNLPLNYFGILRSSKDGYNPTCIECRRCIRLQHYHKDNYKDTIYPIRSHNRHILKAATEEPTIFNGVSIPTKIKIKVEVQIKPYPQFAILDADGEKKAFLVCNLEREGETYKDFFLETVVNFLARHKIRLNADGYDGFMF